MYLSVSLGISGGFTFFFFSCIVFVWGVTVLGLVEFCILFDSGGVVLIVLIIGFGLF